MEKLDDKGFTLVELLAVFVLLLSVSLVTMTGITASLDRREIRECEEQKEMAIGAAKIYFSLDGRDMSRVSVLELRSNGYIKDNKKVDRLKDTDYVDKLDNGYIFNGTDCNE